MDAKTYIKDYAGRADKFLNKFFDRKISEVKKIGGAGGGVEMAVDMLTRYKKFSSGGKKLRGTLIQLGYELAGGKKREALAPSVSIEVIHSFLLMHDDIMDMDSIRRGAPTIHKQFEEVHKKTKSKKDSYHFGVSMGMDMGDLGAYLGMELILDSRLPSDRKIEAATYFSRLLQRVAYGQALDIAYEQRTKITESDVMEVHLQKTSVYTIGGPLKIGALLGGLAGKKVSAIEKFGEPVGIAFQLRDDELGLFSDEKTLGKPVGSDIREGKNTILKIKAIEFTKGEDRRFLKRTYGNRKLSRRDIVRVQKLTINCGALAYSQNLSKKLVAQGKKSIPGITKDEKLASLLASGADFVIERDS
jgi:geranylgeranyl diphosphate synthase type I